MIDASLEIHPEMLHGGRRPTVEHPFSLAAGDDYNVTRWTLSAHAGTHVEAPLHTVADGAAIDALPLELFVGPARVLDLTFVEGDDVCAADLVRAGLGDEERVLLRTRNSETVLRSSEKADAWVGVAPDAAALLVERGVRLLGVDYLTVESPAREATFDAHQILNGAGVALIESVDLASIEAGLVELICPPLRLAAEAAPARVVIVAAGDAGGANAGDGAGDAAGAGAHAGAPIDISIPLGESTLTWGMAPQRIEVETLAGGDHCNVTRWYLGSHSGTHVDAPIHYSDGARTIEQVPLETLAGRCQVLDLTAASADLTAADLLAAGLGDAPRVLLKTRNSRERLLHGSARPEQWIGLSGDGAELLVERGVKLVGIDFLNLEGKAESAGGWAAHHVLCDADVAILEAIDLAAVEAGDYELWALPLPLRGAEAAPARAFLRPLGVSTAGGTAGEAGRP